MSDRNKARSALVDVGQFPFELTPEGVAPGDGTLAEKIAKIVSEGPGYAICHGVSKVIAAMGKDVHSDEAAELARTYLERVYRDAAHHLDVVRASPVAIHYDRIVKMDVDGFMPNKMFSANSDHTSAREFVTTKCIHFDAATPYIANIYGPNINIRGGLPIICDTRQYCIDKKFDPRSLVENIPNNYNVALKQFYYDEILSDYSFIPDVDLDNDLVMIVIHNEVDGGIAHAATEPSLIRPGEPSRRPIRHIEFQFSSREYLEEWYGYYGLAMVNANDEPALQQSREYHRGEQVRPEMIMAKE